MLTPLTKKPFIICLDVQEEKREKGYEVSYSKYQDFRLNSLISILNGLPFTMSNGRKCSCLHISEFPVPPPLRKPHPALWRVNWSFRRNWPRVFYILVFGHPSQMSGIGLKALSCRGQLPWHRVARDFYILVPVFGHPSQITGI